MICGAIPYNSFKEKLRIVKELKREFGKVKIMVLDGIIMYEYRGKLEMNKI